MSETGNTEEEFDGPVVRDRRRIDPVTGQARPGAGSAGKPAGPAAADEPSADALASEELDRLRATCKKQEKMDKKNKKKGSA